MNSVDSMDPAFWGRSTWLSLHTFTFNYPSVPTEEDKQKHYNYFKSLGDMLPCPTCAASYKIYFKYIPLEQYLDDTYGITFWLYIIHYLVNKKLNKSKNNISFLQVVKIYYSQKSSCMQVESTNLNGKCTANSNQVNNINDKIKEFTKVATEKYMTRVADHISTLLKENPNLK
jgi:hypothetical protein